MIVDMLFSFSLTLFALFILLRTRLKWLAVDKPNERSLHTAVVPRTGGLAIMLGVLVTWLFIGVSLEWVILPLALVAISLLDDIRSLKARWRFLTQILVCAAFLVLHPGNIALWVMPIVLIAMVWMINLYNFMDGSDGLAGGIALFGFGAYALAAYLGGQVDLAVLCAVISSASLAFLIFNFHPAKIFMGDSGSIPLGFFAAAIGIWGWQYEVWPYWFPLLVFSPFIVDASMTLLKRLCRREKVWLAHKTHYYQRLVQMGWGHKKTALAFYCLMVIVSSSAILTVQYFSAWLIAAILFWTVLYLVLMLYVDLCWKRYKASNPH